MIRATNRLLRDLEQAIVHRAGRRIRCLRIEILGGAVRLHGKASSYHLKQLAQQAVLDVLPAAVLDNQIEVALLGIAECQAEVEAATADDLETGPSADPS